MERLIGAVLMEIDGAWTKREVALLKTFTAYVEWDDPSTKLYVGIVPGIPGAHTQAQNLDELCRNLEELLILCLQEYEG